MNINGTNVEFVDGTEQNFDAIIFATGYKSGANKWLKVIIKCYKNNSLPILVPLNSFFTLLLITFAGFPTRS